MILTSKNADRAKALCLSLVSAASFLHAAPPTLTTIFPAGGKLGETIKVEFLGANLSDATFWSSIPNLSIKKAPEQNLWWVTIPEDAPIGPSLLFAKNAEGVSAPRWFTLGRLNEITEVEPNNKLSEATKIEALPVTVNGHHRLGNDVDVYAVSLAKGQKLLGLIEAYSLGSHLDPHIHVLNSKGIRIATFTESQNLDPILEFTAPETGTYYLELAAFAHPPEANVAFKSAPNSSYRLHLHSGPVATHLESPVAVAGKKILTQLKGIGLNPNQSQFELDPTFLRQSGSNWLTVPTQSIYPIPVQHATHFLGLEKEPNQQISEATKLESLGSITGKIDSPDDKDFYVVSAKKGQRIKAHITAQRLNSSIDTSLRVYDASGKLVTEADDFFTSPDPRVLLTVPADQDYYFEVSSLFPAPTSSTQYVLTVEENRPSFTAQVTTPNSLFLEPGKSLEINVDFRFDAGFQDEVKLVASNLPSGVTAEPVKVAPKNGVQKLKLSAAANAEANQVQIKLECWDQQNQITPVHIQLRGEEKRGFTLLDEIDFLWLTVKGAKSSK